MRDLTVLGGGITGLSAAYLAAKNGCRVTLVEAAPEIGGLMGTFPVAGTHLEQFYHHFFTHDAELRWFLRELGIEDSLEFYRGTMGFFRNGRIYRFDRPSDLLGFSPLGWVDKLRFLASAYYLGRMADWKKWESVPALEWFERFAGRAVTDCIWRPMMETKFGSHAPRVPAAWMVGRLHQRLHSRQDGEEKLGYVRGSLKTLNDALVPCLRRLGVTLRTSCRVKDLVVENGELKGLVTDGGDLTGGDFLATLPAPALAALVEPHDRQFARELRRIRYSGTLCTVLELHRPLSGIYWLNVADRGYPFSGVIEHTNLVGSGKYGRHIIYLPRHYAAGEDTAGLPLEDIKEQMISALGGIFPKFDRSWVLKAQVFRAPASSIACELHHSKIVPDCRTRIKNLYLAGMCHVYPDERSCNNAIRVAAEACRVMGMDASFVPAGRSLSGKIGM